MPGSMPGGLVTLQQYLDANQPAVQRTQGALDQQALNPYQQALQGATTAATQAAQQSYAAQAQQQAADAARAKQADLAPMQPARRTTAAIPYSGAVAQSPAAQAALQNATAGVQAAADKAGLATADPGARASALYTMYGSGGANGGGLPYSLGDAGLDAALTGQTAAPNVSGDLSRALGAAPAVSGTATASAPPARNPGPTGANPHVPDADPRRDRFNP